MGNVTFHPRQGPFASSWARCGREWLFVGVPTKPRSERSVLGGTDLSWWSHSRGGVNVLANGSAGGSGTLLKNLSRLSFSQGQEPLAKCGAALDRDGRCSRVARVGKIQFSRGVDRNDKGFPLLLAPTNFDKKRHLRDAKARHLSEPRATCSEGVC